jgi:hypothetical protein
VDSKRADILSSIFEFITGIMAEVDAIAKTKENKEQGFRFRGIDDVYNMIHPLMSRFGVFSVPEVLEERTEERKSKYGGNLIYRMLKMKYTFFAQDGSSVSATVIGEGMDSGDKASNKAMAVAHKYALIQMFSIPTDEMGAIDPDGETPPPSVPLKQNPAIRQFDMLAFEQMLDDAMAKGLITDAQKKQKMDYAANRAPENLPAYIVSIEKQIKALQGVS